MARGDKTEDLVIGKGGLGRNPLHPDDCVCEDCTSTKRVPFITKDSGKRQEFASGMVRDTAEGKIEWHKIMDGPMTERWAALLTRGAIKYPDPEPGVGNWTLASGKAELARFRASAYRHFMQWYRGEIDEDHAAAVFFNINGAEYVKEKLNG